MEFFKFFFEMDNDKVKTNVHIAVLALMCQKYPEMVLSYKCSYMKSLGCELNFLYFSTKILFQVKEAYDLLFSLLLFI